MLTASGAATADNSVQAADGNGPVTPVAYIGDVPSSEEDAYFAEDAETAEAISQATHTERASYQRHQAPKRMAALPQQTQQSMQHQLMYQPAPQQQTLVHQPYAPVSVQQLRSGGAYQNVGYNDPCGSACCDSGCDSGCDSCGGGGCGCSMNMAGMMGLCDSDGWCRHELLLWFVETRELPPLVTVSEPRTLPIIGMGNTQTVFGGNAGGDLSVGYRADIGKYFGDNVGIGGRFWVLGESKDDIQLGGDGTDFSIGRPYYDNDRNRNDALLVALDPGVADIEGVVSAESKINILAAEAYARLNFSCSKNCQLDFIGGYSYFQVDDVLRISSTSETVTSSRTFSDVFDCENRFNGGQIGFESTIKRGRLMARALTKVHLGNMGQRVRIAGQSIEDFGPLVAPTFANSGLYTMGNQGDFQRDIFTFVPEMNLKLSYRAGNHVEVSAGYSLVYFDRVALAGVNVDPTLDPVFLNTNGPFPSRPAFTFEDDSLWIQGIDLGMAITY